MIEITNGPSFRDLMFNSHLSDCTEDCLTFTVKSFPEEKSKIGMQILFLGRPSRDKKDWEDVHGFIGRKRIVYTFMGSIMSQEKRFYIGTYNVKTRTGTCTEFGVHECMASPIFCALFGI
jgi:hypothetical protein